MERAIAIVLGFLLIFGLAYSRHQVRADEVLDQYRWHAWVVENGDKWNGSFRTCIQERWRTTNIWGCNYRFLGHS